MNFLLAGNPNTGKSTFFNMMTQSHVHVGNYSGVTVEKRVHHLKHYPHANLVDLPGTYNITPSSEDEGVVTYTLLKESYNGIINIIDSTHLKRNLHLTVQLLELGVPMLLVFNLKDSLHNNGYVVDTKKVTELLEVNAISLSAREHNTEDIDHVIDELKHINSFNALELDYPEVIKHGIDQIEELLRFDTLQVKKKWLALQLLEGNEDVYKYVTIQKEAAIRQIVADVEQTIIDQ
ncbi:MAG: 50S ribosome-binding GTPase, partial [Candidatus Izimaplasma sp.]|nr:50S ribosome-binding GTPase [Candidatus Izimaplasma bacterium]